MRVGWMLLVAVLAACQASPEPTPTPPPTATPPGEPVEVVSLCGLDWPVIDYAGSRWRFDVGSDGNPPRGWSGTDTIYIRTLDDGTVHALGPDGLVYRLVETDERQPDGCL